MKTVEWKLHLKTSPADVFEFLATASGRETFWAEEAPEIEGFIQFAFPNGSGYHSKIIKSIPHREFHIEYFNSLVRIILTPTAAGGTELLLFNEDIPEEDFLEVHAGWVSILMNLKASADFGCDLRNHDKNRTWDHKYVDN